MPSRADTRPFVFASVGAADGHGSGSETSRWVSRSGAGLFGGVGAAALLQRIRRDHALSPMVPMDMMLRMALPKLRASDRAGPTAVVALAEQTLTAATMGGFGVWVVRASSVLATTVAEPVQGISSRQSSINVRLSVDDMVVLGDAGLPGDEVLSVAAGGLDRGPALLLRCEAPETSEVWKPVSSHAPNPVWVNTVFNEYGTNTKR